MREAIYVNKTKNKFKKIMDGHVSDLLHPLKNGQKPDSFLTIPNSTLMILHHVQTYTSKWRLR